MTILHSYCCWRSVRKGSFACGAYTAILIINNYLMIFLALIARSFAQSCSMGDSCNAQPDDEDDEDDECPLDRTFDMEPYADCPGYAQIPPPGVLVYTSGKRITPERQCRRCDLRLNAQNTGVYVKCWQCYGMPKNEKASWGIFPNRGA
ncbi:unnamed protein product [Phyllotreta striolata]|uniref:Uncharacterized protein n=1 Tax=Phyllotreta striolata TaxID=444603 RepID=A0A9N9TN73_PHYSR|nr:unnamed protein product [Phyllotreta striolata]